MPRQIATLTLADAREIIAAGEQKAQEIGIPYNLAVVDAGGALIAHVRMDGAWLEASTSRFTRHSPRAPSTWRPKILPGWLSRASPCSESTAPITKRWSSLRAESPSSWEMR